MSELRDDERILSYFFGSSLFPKPGFPSFIDKRRVNRKKSKSLLWDTTDSRLQGYHRHLCPEPSCHPSVSPFCSIPKRDHLTSQDSPGTTARQAHLQRQRIWSCARMTRSPCLLPRCVILSLSTGGNPHQLSFLKLWVLSVEFIKTRVADHVNAMKKRVHEEEGWQGLETHLPRKCVGPEAMEWHWLCKPSEDACR